jgi:glycosyltransferase involved in cell wall biosynthesis
VNSPKISVIVAAYNQQQFIGRCLRSLLHQTLPHDDYEIIVVDDGSTDKTPYALELFCDPFDSVVKVITNKKNLGLPASLNRAIQKASAPLIVRVDSDDFVNSNFLNFLNFYLESNSEVDAVACDYLLLDDEENVIEKANCFEKPIACGILFRKSQLIEIGLYDETFLRHEERDLRLRFEKKYRINRLDIPLYRYRRHSNNITNDLEAMNHHEERLLSKHATT